MSTLKSVSPPPAVGFFLGSDGVNMHYYQFNIGDYQTHTGHLDPLEDIAYRRMLDWCYLHERPLPESFDEVAKLIRMRQHVDSIKAVLEEFFELTSTGWWKERIGKEIDKAGEKSRKASQSAQSRWKKISPEDMRTQSDGSANAMRDACEGNATQDPLPNTQNPKPKVKSPSAMRPAVPRPAGVDEQTWSDWLLIRKTKRLPLTETAWTQLEAEAQKASLPMDRVIKECCLRGWGAFKASWWEREQAPVKNQGDRNADVMQGLTRGLIGGNRNVKLLGN